MATAVVNNNATGHTSPSVSLKDDTATSTVTPTREKSAVVSDPKSRRRKINGQNNPHMVVDKKVVDELLLVCGVIGSTVDPTSNKIVPVTDCLNWLQDLQRALRRDDDAKRSISLLLGKWKIVQQKLLPLVLSCQYDTDLVITIVKILVILTKPLSESAIKAGKMIININNEDDIIQEQNKLRDNAIAQSNLLIEYKNLFVHHPSHHENSLKKNKTKSKGLLSILVSLLADPLSRTGSSRSSQDHLTIELILHLFRNLLCAGGSLLKGGNHVSSEKKQESIILHQQLICLFDKELVLDILLVIGQEMESRENRQYNLLIMEILHHLLKRQDPTLVARGIRDNSISSAGKLSHLPTNDKRSSGKNSMLQRNLGKVPDLKTSSSRSSTTNSLKAQLQKERQNIHATTTSRHSHFGGTLVIQKPDGKQRFVDASSAQAMTSQSSVKFSSSISNTVSARRKSKKNQPFIGTGRTLAVYARPGLTSLSTMQDTGPTSQRAQCALNSFCAKFSKKCYGPVMKSLKNEFRRDSGRLEGGDKVTFFRIVWFFCQWWRVAHGSNNNTNQVIDGKDDKSICPTAAGHLIFTMDVFTYNLVLSAMDTYSQHKKYKELEQTVSLYTEMMQLLYAMYNSKDSTEHIMALGLMDRLFYCAEPIDRLPKLLSQWMPGTFTGEYMCDLVEILHVTLKLLDANSRTCEKLSHTNELKHRQKKKRNDDGPKDTISRMNEAAAEFNVISYLARKIITNQVVFMFTQLLSKYNINAVHLNHHIVSFFVRLCKFEIIKDGYDDFERFEDVTTILPRKNITLEPMLFNIQLLMVLHEILNDSTLQKVKEHKSLLTFSATLVRHYARSCEQNPLLHVETLFRHSLPHRFCEMSINMYVSEELKLLVERDALLEEHHHEDTEEDLNQLDAKDSDDGSTNKHERIIPTGKLSKEDKKDNIDIESEDEIEFDDQFDQAKELDRVNEKEVSPGENNDLKMSSTNPDISMDTVEVNKVDEGLTSDLEGKITNSIQNKNDPIPKRKLDQSDRYGNNIQKEKKQKGSQRKLIRKVIIDDSDDDVDFGDANSATNNTGTLKSSRLVFEDDE